MLGLATLRAPKNVAAVVAFAALFIVLAVAGGASRADQLGQPIVRGVALLALALIVIVRAQLEWARVKPILIVLGYAALICLIQLAPLPPPIWDALGGRADFAILSTDLGLPEVWRPLSLTPDATINALFSLTVPLAVAVILAALDPKQIRALLPGLIGFITLSAVIGLVQLGNNDLSNPFLNETRGEAAGVFANRNHQALFLAIGLLLLPPWAMRADWRESWMRTATAVALVPFLLLMVLATGSRAGLVLAAVALLLNIWICADTIGGIVRRARASPIRLGVIMLAGLSMLIGLVLVASRTRTLDRLFATDAVEDFRFRAFPTVQALIGDYFPFGSGLGSFDAVFRAAEPFALLRTTYFNHAHNDFAEIAMEAGLPGIALIIGAVIWIVSRAAVSQRASDRDARRQALAGAGIIVLILVASAVDYPARVPVYMAVLTIAASWLYVPFAQRGLNRIRRGVAALP